MNRDVLPEQTSANAIVQEGTLLQQGRSPEVEEHEAKQVEDSGWFENDRVFPRR